MVDFYVVIMSVEGYVIMFLFKSDLYGGRYYRLALYKFSLYYVGFFFYFWGLGSLFVFIIDFCFRFCSSLR